MCLASTTVTTAGRYRPLQTVTNRYRPLQTVTGRRAPPFCAPTAATAASSLAASRAACAEAARASLRQRSELAWFVCQANTPQGARRRSQGGGQTARASAASQFKLRPRLLGPVHQPLRRPGQLLGSEKLRSHCEAVDALTV